MGQPWRTPATRGKGTTITGSTAGVRHHQTTSATASPILPSRPTTEAIFQPDSDSLNQQISRPTPIAPRVKIPTGLAHAPNSAHRSRNEPLSAENYQGRLTSHRIRWQNLNLSRPRADSHRSHKNFSYWFCPISPSHCSLMVDPDRDSDRCAARYRPHSHLCR